MTTKKNDTITEAEQALGGQAVDAPEIDSQAPPGFEGGERIRSTEPKVFTISLATSEEIAEVTRTNFTQFARINRGKALVRFAVRLNDQLIGIVTARYSISNNGAISGPFVFRNSDWAQYQAGHNSVLQSLRAVAKQDDDNGAYFEDLLKRANLSTFEANRGNGSYAEVSGPIVDDVYAFARQYEGFLKTKVASLPLPQSQAVNS